MAVSRPVCYLPRPWDPFPWSCFLTSLSPSYVCAGIYSSWILSVLLAQSSGLSTAVLPLMSSGDLPVVWYHLSTWQERSHPLWLPDEDGKLDFFQLDFCCTPHHQPGGEQSINHYALSPAVQPHIHPFSCLPIQIKTSQLGYQNIVGGCWKKWYLLLTPHPQIPVIFLGDLTKCLCVYVWWNPAFIIGTAATEKGE